MFSSSHSVFVKRWSCYDDEEALCCIHPRNQIRCLRWPFQEPQLGVVKERVSLVLRAVADAAVSTCDCTLLKLRVILPGVLVFF